MSGHGRKSHNDNANLISDPRVAAGSADRLLRCVKRADFWKDDPDIVRRINDQLASGAG